MVAPDPGRRLQRERDDDEAGDDRRTASLAGLAVILFLALAALFLIRELTKVSEIQDCVMQGRSNCAPVE
jgi:hypothetical protein